MDGSLEVNGQPSAKRVKWTCSPVPAYNRQADMTSQQLGWHPTPLSQQQREHSSHSDKQQQSHQPVGNPACSFPVGVAMTNLYAADGSTGQSCLSNNTLFYSSFKRLPSASQFTSFSQPQFDALEGNLGIVQGSPSQQQHWPAYGALEVDTKPPSTSSAKPSTLQRDSSSTRLSHSFYSSQTIQPRTASANLSPRPVVPSNGPIRTSGRAIRGDSPQPSSNADGHVRKGLQDPFEDYLDTFGLCTLSLFEGRKVNEVNGYVKFTMLKDGRGKPSSVNRTTSICNSRVIKFDDSMEPADESASQYSMPSGHRSQMPLTSVNNSAKVAYGISNTVNQYSAGSSTPRSLAGCTLPSTCLSASTEVASMGAPKMLPFRYGHEARMDDIDSHFWFFYIQNWCPGRSVLDNTNPWLKDFAQMQKHSGVRSAILSLAGIYMYDYVPSDAICRRVNLRFSEAQKKFSQLLRHSAIATDTEQASELITIAVILSMQDIVLTERRHQLEKPPLPRWLQGFRLGEQFLRSIDDGSRYWKKVNVQSSSLRISQAIIVARSVILTELMSPLPSAKFFNSQEEVTRFGWLLHGTREEVHQIHGGCGFSRKLLHIFSQATYCAARLQQEPKSTMVSVTAKFLYKELLDMMQWSTGEVADSEPSFTEWVDSQPKHFQIGTNADMTRATAEAWRLAAILYLHCRVFRWPRNHRKVLSRLDDLAKIIAVMPKSGSQFTAQAPLFPVFLLGVLATKQTHKEVSKSWFKEVLKTPVRSSVPPLRKALKGIWTWIDEDIPVTSSPNSKPSKSIHRREPWWENLITKVQQQEEEVLCLT